MYYVKVGIIAQKNVEIPVLPIDLRLGRGQSNIFCLQNIGIISVIWSHFGHYNGTENIPGSTPGNYCSS